MSFERTFLWVSYGLVGVAFLAVALSGELGTAAPVAFVLAYLASYFRRTDGFWYDSVIPKGESPKPAIEVVAYSPEFFKLLDRFPVLRKYLLVGEKLLIDIDGVIIRITAE
mgnify:CR=1 FL=1